MTSPFKMLFNADLCRCCGQDCKDDKDRLEIGGSFTANVRAVSVTISTDILR
jgi:hypothetical protein